MRYCFVCDQPVRTETCPDCGRPAHDAASARRTWRIPVVPKRWLVVGVALALVFLFLLVQVRWGIR